MKSPLSDSLHQLMHAYRSQLRLAIVRAGIEWPVTHLRILKGIDHQPGCNARDIASWMRADKAQITRALNEMRAAGLIDSQHNPADRRSQQLRLSAAGQRLRQQLQHAEDAAVAELTRPLNPAEVDTFIGLAQRLLNPATPACTTEEN
ncbi:MarR family winged helix-turn-helix transcriptional regulator [Saccharospirillum mangrovi]|uniref:MarR family winged helix-turn-helix transcriptional regulator n=1 Tax=Saccharospirillum mangrovi TaxID=2161747 RepID=UPI000D332386|nr:MarR family winged helix-turn-helix transcriptional regulator [Saccharospirillum mangrovi]